jgi:hypothetical protein
MLGVFWRCVDGTAHLEEDLVLDGLVGFGPTRL